MIIYEITARVQKAQVEKFEQFMLEKHIPDLLETGRFSGAEIARFPENCYRIRYNAVDKTSLDEYLANDAGELRKDFQRNFPGGGIELSREILAIIRKWDTPE